MRIGVLASQGAFAEHIAIIRRLKQEAFPVRLTRELARLDGLIIPGGESTSISKLMSAYNLMGKIKSLAQDGLPVFGTCAGMILMAKDTSDSDAKLLDLMDISVRRNAFGRQRESFETRLAISSLGDEPFPGVFIRAPLIERVGDDVEVLSRLSDGTIVAARQKRLLVSSFHPELTGDLRFHRYFLNIVSNGNSPKPAG